MWNAYTSPGLLIFTFKWKTKCSHLEHCFAVVIWFDDGWDFILPGKSVSYPLSCIYLNLCPRRDSFQM
jgi:hypothetical protein